MFFEMALEICVNIMFENMVKLVFDIICEIDFEILVGSIFEIDVAIMFEIVFELFVSKLEQSASLYTNALAAHNRYKRGHRKLDDNCATLEKQHESSR